MKKNIFKISIYTIAIIFTLASLTVTLAWYTNVNRVGSIDGNSDDITITYNINDREEKNEKNYKINNLAFFDKYASNEIKYFNDMTSVIKIRVNNLDNKAKSIKLTFSSLKVIKGNNESIAYPVGIISKDSFIDITNKNSIEELLPQDRIELDDSYKTELILDCKPNSYLDFYIHIFGVQEIKSADNSFLINPDGSTVAYNFSIIIEGINK